MLFHSLKNAHMYISENFRYSFKKCMENSDNFVNLYIVSDDKKTVYHNPYTRKLYTCRQFNNLLLTSTIFLDHLNKREHKIYFDCGNNFISEQSLFNSLDPIVYFSIDNNSINQFYQKYEINEDNLLMLSLRQKPFEKKSIIHTTKHNKKSQEIYDELINRSRIDQLSNIEKNKIICILSKYDNFKGIKDLSNIFPFTE